MQELFELFSNRLNRPWQLCLFALAIFMVFYLIGCISARNGPPSPSSAFNSPDPVHIAPTVVQTLPTPPGAQIQAVTNKVFNTMTVNAIQPPPAVHTNEVSIVMYVPPNGGNDTNRRWTVLQAQIKGHWNTVTSNEQASGYYVTNNVISTNPMVFFRTVSQ